MTTETKLIKGKMGLLELASYLGNVSGACRTLGYSRDTFYRLKKRYEEDGLDGLKELSRRKPNRKNRIPEELEEKILQLSIEFPAYGQVRMANKVLESMGHSISPAGVRCVWMRHGLGDNQEAFEGA